MAKLDLLNLSGGYVDGVSPVDLEDNQFVELQNWILRGGRLARRDGVGLVTTGTISLEFTTRTNSVFSFQEHTGAWTVIVGKRDSVAKLNTATRLLTDLTMPSGVPGFRRFDPSIANAAAIKPFKFLQYLDTGYAARHGSGLWRFDLQLIEPAGIPAPLVAPTIASGAAGVVEAGDYFAVFTEFNTFTGAESNPSPASSKLVQAGSLTIDWTVPLAITRQANARNLYRTLPNQRGEYFFIKTLLNSAGTAFNDNTVIDNFGRPVSFDNGMPPGDIRVIELWNERIVASNGIDVFVSEAQLPESFAEDMVIEVFQDDGHDVRTLTALNDRCVIGKTNRIHAIIQTGPRRFERSTVSDRHGLFSNASCQVAEGRMFGFGGDNFYVTDGLSAKAIGNKEVRRLVDALDPKFYEMVSAEIWERDSLYIATLPGRPPLPDGVSSPSGWQGAPIPGPTNTGMVVYDYKNNVWYTFRNDHGLAPSFFGSIFDANLIKHLYATYYDAELYEFMKTGETRDFISTLTGNNTSSAIVARLRTKAFLSKAGAGLLLALKQLWVLASNVGQELKIQVFSHPKQLTATTERTVSLTGDGWKLYNLSNMRRPGTTVQVGVEYSGADPIELEALGLEVRNIFQHRRAK